MEDERIQRARKLKLKSKKRKRSDTITDVKKRAKNCDIDDNGQTAIDVSDEEKDETNSDDPFRHFENILDDNTVEKLSDRSNWQTQTDNVPILGKIMNHTPPNTTTFHFDLKQKLPDLSLLKKQLLDNLPRANKKACNTSDALTDLQSVFYNLCSQYIDVYYPERNSCNGEELRFCYCVHALNHILKTRSKIVHHNAKLNHRDETPDEYRDQGLTRPKVVIIVPFRESALRIVKIFMDLISPDGKANIINKKRFQNEFGSDEPPVERARKRPDDYEVTFSGNTDDMFRFGIAITKKSLKLYADFYSADILVASPLGLRSVIGSEGDERRDFDFLSSIELLIMDQMEIFLMQNWSHVLHILSHFHLQPSESHGVDFSRVRMWTLNGWSKFYRQTILLSSIANPAIKAVFNKHCFNYAGKLEFVNPVIRGTICQVVVQVPQVFQSFTATNASELPNARFQHFSTKILPQYRDGIMSHTMIYIPSYYDFVRVRNYFKKEGISFVQICEYSQPGKISRARDLFFHGEKHFLLYTERAHFYHRYVIKGIRHIIFYELPIFPHFYSELCNMLQLSNQKSLTENEKGDSTCLALYAAQDAQQLSAVVSYDRTCRMISSDKKVHMFVSGETA